MIEFLIRVGTRGAVNVGPVVLSLTLLVDSGLEIFLNSKWEL